MSIWTKQWAIAMCWIGVGWGLLVAPGAIAQDAWTRIPGEARDIAVGADGTVWIARGDDGAAQWRTQDGAWHEIDGAADRITVAADGTPWVIHDGAVYRLRGANWQRVPGEGRDIGAGPDGSVWVAGPDGNVLQWEEEGFGWQQRSGSAQHVAVAADGTPWAVNGGAVYRRRGDNWQRLPGEARDVGTGSGGSVWVVGPENGVFQWQDDAYAWMRIEGRGQRIAVAPDAIYRRVVN